jgi:hypothetical protein
MPVAVTGIEGGDLTSPRGRWLGWVWLGTRFRLQLEISPNYVGSDFDTAKLHLSADDQEVMTLDVSQRLQDEYYRWRVFGVSALKAGAWMAQLNDLAGQLQVAERQSTLDRERSFYGEKAQKIELD